MDGAVRSAWIDHDYSHTSITDFDELYEQLFDDLDSDSFLEGLPSLLPDVHCQRAIREFLLAIKAVDFELRSVLDKKDYRGLFASQPWSIVTYSAQTVVNVFRK